MSKPKAEGQAKRLTGAMKKKRITNGGKTNAVSIEAKARAAIALQKRMEGKTFQVIADDPECPYNSAQAAFEAVKRALDAVIREPAEALVRLELDRIDKLWEIHYLNAQAGDVMATAACMRLMERRSRYLGLDAPVKTKAELTGADGTPLMPAVTVQATVDLTKLSIEERRTYLDLTRKLHNAAAGARPIPG